jgi:hypothetical protein
MIGTILGIGFLIACAVAGALILWWEFRRG